MQADDRRDLYVYNSGLLTGRRVRRILALAGWDVRLGLPGSDDWVGVWGQSPTAPRGEAVARRRDAPVLRVEDAFLRSVLPGRSGEPPIGLSLDSRGVHFDPTGPSDLEHILAEHPLDDTAMLDAARASLERMNYWHVSKYNDFNPLADLPPAPYVLVIDQTRGDASVTASGANADRFREMLVFAQSEHPGLPVVIKAHPETAGGYRPGYFSAEDASDRVTLLADPISPFALMQGATGVYTVSSQLGFEAIFAGHRPRVFGQPFYAGWGLTEDEYPLARRTRKLSRAQLFAAAMVIYPTWYDPHEDGLCDLDRVIDVLAARARAHREDAQGYVASGMRAWKRPLLRAFFGKETRVQFLSDGAKARQIAERRGRKHLVWGATGIAGSVVRLEDGFLRSRGLGAQLVPPMSLVADDLGIYYDPARESRLERLITASVDLGDAERARAERLISQITEGGISKYNLGLDRPGDLPDGCRILITGQVEDDASVVLGCDAVATNLDLLIAARGANRDAAILYKPHPDVEAGLRGGALSDEQAGGLADRVLESIDAGAVVEAVDEVWTMTSLLGFEALLRGKPVTCLGMPFYAGWGLTTDLGVRQLRRQERPDLIGLVHATLIGYPRYFDPLTGQACPVEVVVERLADPDLRVPRVNKAVAYLQRLVPRGFRDGRAGKLR